jgi:hypothetical protein
LSPRQIKGNYWAIATLENKQHQYWLVPNNNISFNIHKLKTVESLFQLKGDYNSPNSDFILEEPAVLSLLPDNKQWKLLQPGVLLFGNDLRSVSTQLKQSQNVADDEQSKINKQMLSTLAAFQSKVEQLDNKIVQLEMQSEISHQAYQREWLSEKQALNQQLQKTDVLQSQLTNFKTKIVNSFDNYNLASIESDRHVNNDSNSINEPQEGSLYNEIGDHNFFDKSNNQQDIKPENHSNDSFQSFYRLIKNGKLQVTEVKLSQEKMRGTTNSELKFLNDRKGNFWIVYWHSVYCLIPKEKTIINLHQYTNFQRVFDCQNYQETYREFKIIEPTTVENSNDRTWQLKRKGKIKFMIDTQNEIEDLKNQDNKNKKINLTTQISQFRQAYTQDIKLIQDLIIAKVAISVETLEQITFYQPDTIILENTSHGKYWIIDYSGNYFLIPSEIQHITDAKETSLTIARLLFHLSGYYPQYSSYHLIRPAIVTKVSTNQWKLEEKGKFNFS